MDTAELAGLAAILAATGGLVAAVTQLVIALRSMHTQINGRMDELVASNRAAGVAQGIAQEQSRASAGPAPLPSASLDASKRPPPA